MRIGGVIAEYNPFHNGHTELLRRARAACERVVVVMSGDFVQRGEVAMSPKLQRAAWALQNGADMVLALPTVCSLASAQRFAAGAVHILARSGVVDTLYFGSECGDTALLLDAASRLHEENEEFQTALRAALQSGKSYPAAFAQAAMLPPGLGPNDILGIEYLRALRQESRAMQPQAVLRLGAGHDAAAITPMSASASAIRQAIAVGNAERIKNCVPPGVWEDILSAPPRTDAGLSDAVLYALRRMNREQLMQLPDIAEGLENLLYTNARSCTSYAQLLMACKSKRYTMARLKRLCMCALLGIDASLLTLPSYIRVLGVRADAKELLSALCTRAALPVITRFAQVQSLDAQRQRLHEVDVRAAEIACLANGTPAVFDYAFPLILS